MDREYLPTLLAGLQEAVFILDGSRRVIHTNGAAEAIFGRGYVGNDFVHVVRQPECLAAIGTVMKGGSPQRVNLVLDMPVAAHFEFQASDLGKGHADGARVLVTLVDISDRQQAQRMRSDFVANVSHELRSPLTAISGFIETLQTSAKDDPEGQQRFLHLMSRETDRMVRLIADLLSLSKVQAQNRMRPRENTDVAQIIQRVCSTLSSLSEAENVTVTVGPLPTNTHVVGVEDELTTVLQNLLENAIKYGKVGGTVSVEITQVPRASGVVGPALRIIVADEGPGIAQEHIARLTERFYRVDLHRSRNKGGTGLGLAIVKHIINRHRGRMTIQSTLGEGSRFTVYLPQAHGEDAHAEGAV